jgi:hypothetical protein
MIRKLLLASAWFAGGALAITSLAAAWTAVGPHGGWVHGDGWHGGWHGCCWGGGSVAAGVAVGAVGVAAASRPAYVVPAPVYAPPRALYVAPPVVYGPGYYYVR